MPALTDTTIRHALKRVEISRKQENLADGEGRGTGRLVLVLKPMPKRVTADWMAQQWRDEKRLKKACNRSRQVVLYLYGGRGTSVWWKQNQGKLGLHDNLTVIELSDSQTLPLTAMVERTMQLTCTISDGQLWVSNGTLEVTLDPVVLMGRAAREL